MDDLFAELAVEAKTFVILAVSAVILLAGVVALGVGLVHFAMALWG
jgi:hypothetical protein